MRRLLILLILLAIKLSASTTIITGIIRDEQGNPLNGTLTMRLPIPAQDPSTNTAIAPTPVNFQLINGQVTGGAPLYDLATIQPANLWYAARGYDTAGRLAWYGNFYVTGASFNIGNATPTTVTTSNISFTNLPNLASPPPIGGMAPNTGAFTTLSTTGLATLNSLSVTNNTNTQTFGLATSPGIPNGTAGYNTMTLGNLQGTYSYFPLSFWTGQRAPIKFVWETNQASTSTPASGDELGISATMFMNPTSGSVTNYAKALANFQVFITDNTAHNVGSGAVGFNTTVLADGGGLSGGTDTVIQIGDPTHTGFTTAGGQAAELDVFNYGTNQPTMNASGSTRGQAIVCGSFNANEQNCTVGLNIYSDATHNFYTGIDIDSSINSSLSVNGTSIIGPTGKLQTGGFLTGTTGTITGTALTNTCDSGTVAVTGAAVGSPVVVGTTDGTDIGGAFNIRGSVTSSGTVTVFVCGNGTPPSKAYNVRVIP